ncbi:ALQxL family class IV lanthipeptide [Herbidospora solisilvae]|nr:ALQxL family class IV lanthipeptide [Herbidospora solisilvae]
MELDVNALDLLPAQRESGLMKCTMSCDVSAVETDPETGATHGHM